MSRFVPSLRRSRAHAEDDPLAAADRLAAAGRALEALDLLVEASRRKRDADLDRRLVPARHRAFAEVLASARPADPPSPAASADAAARVDVDADGVPTIAAADLTAAAIAAAIQGHGCLLVRGLVDPVRAGALVTSVDEVFRARDAHATGAPVTETTSWYEPFEADGEYAAAIALGRGFVNKGSGTWIADSPRLLQDLLSTYDEIGLNSTIAEFLGERPAISVNKGTLRRLPPEGGTEWWHQDGAFLGEGIRALNVWLALTPCGTDAPGLDLVTRRLDQIVGPGEGDADFTWSLGDEAVAEVAGGRIARPDFQPGDALLFDHLFLHRTGTDAGMTQSRYATETWFFAPSHYPDPHEQVPLVL